MLTRIASWALDNVLAVFCFTLLIAVCGFICFENLTIEAFPDPSDPQVEVVTQFPGQSTEEVERQLGLPLERGLNGTPGMLRLRNLSLFGLSDIVMTFADGTDVQQARALVLQRLRDVDLPDGVVPALAPNATPIGEVYRYTVGGAGGDTLKLRELQDWVIRPALLRVQGVADVITFGGLSKEIHVQPSPARLMANDVTVSDLEDALKNASVNASGGLTQRGAEGIVITSAGLLNSVEDIGQIAITQRNGTPVLVRDVADIATAWAPRQGVASHGKTTDVVQAKIVMARGENPSVVLDRIRKAVKEIGAGLPDGARIDPFYDRTDLVDTTLKTVRRNLVEGALLVVAVLWIFLMNLRAALIVGTLIPLSLLFSFGYLYLRGMSANILSMGAVDFGIIVDGAVVVIEAILLRLSMQTPDESPLNSIRQALNAIIRPTVFSLAIIIAAYLPIFMLQRVEGRVFGPMAHTVVSALSGALLFSITLVPVLAFLFLRTYRGGHAESPVLKLAASAYRPALRAALRFPLPVVVATVAAVTLAGFTLQRLGSEFLPAMNEGSLYITFTLPQNISIEEARRWMPKIQETFAKYPAVSDVVMMLGRPEDGTDPNLPNNLEALVRLKPPHEWPAGIRNIDELIADMTPLTATIPGIDTVYSQPIADNVNDSISGQPGDIACKIYGQDLDQMQAAAEKWKDILATVPGVADLGIVKCAEQPQLQVLPDRERLGRYGLSIADFQHTVGASLGGIHTGTLWQGEIPVPIVLRFPERARADQAEIEQLQIPSKTGKAIPLKAVANVRNGAGRASILRENGRRYIGLRMDVRGRDLGSFMEEAMQKTSAKAPLPASMSFEWGGSFESKERATKRLSQVVPVTLVLTLLLLFGAFGDFLLAGLVMLTVPLALIGGVAALWVFKLPLSVAATVGFIALIGQASLNGVLIISAVEERVKHHQELVSAIVDGCIERLRPVLMTGSLAALGLLPAAVSRDMGSETQQPIAVVVVGGTISAMALTLVVLPVLYLLLARVTGRGTQQRVLPAVAAPEPVEANELV